MSKFFKPDAMKSDAFVDTKMYSGSDRRIRGERVDVSFPVSVTHDGILIHGYTEALNLSWSGMLLATNFPLTSNDLVDLEFILPDSEIVLHVRGRITRVAESPTPEAPVIMGVLFTEVDTNVARMIQGYVLANLPDHTT